MKIHHYGIEVKNLDDAKSFYMNQLGFQEEFTLEVLGVKLVFLKNANIRIELVESNEVGSCHICFSVNNINELMIESEPIEGPYSLPNGWITVFYDGPSGEVIEFLQTEDSDSIML